MLAATAFLDHSNGPAETATVDALAGAIAKAAGGDIPLYERCDREEDRYRVLPWVQGGLLVEAAARLDGSGAQGAARRRVLRGAARLLPAAWSSRPPGLCSSLIVDAADGEVLAKSGAATGEEMLFFALGLLRRAEASSVPVPAEWSLIAKTALANLRIDKKRLTGKELSQLMWLRARF